MSNAERADLARPTRNLRLVAHASRSSALFTTPRRYPVDHIPATDDGHRLSDHENCYGSLPDVNSMQLRSIVQSADLRGRGGAWFPMAAKWRAAIEAGGAAIVIANGSESEPAAAKDAALLTARPHLVIDGLLLAARAVRARRAILWVHDGTHARAVAAALQERAARSGRESAIEVQVGPAGYLSGEASSIVNFLSGGPALPQFRSRPLAIAGLDGLPTLVHNVESLARLALVARSEAASTSAVLVTVATAAGRTVADVEPEEVGELVDAEAGERPAAVLIGGFGGVWMDRAHLDAAVTTPALGAGVILPLLTGACGLAATAQVLAYLSASRGRQCGPCTFGLPTLAAEFAVLARPRRTTRGIRDRVSDLADQLTGRGACHHPDATTTMAMSALRIFDDEITRHRRGSCISEDAQLNFYPIPTAGTH